MAKTKKVVHGQTGEEYGRRFDCPGCGSPHVVTTVGPHAWGFNGSDERPTFTPSIEVTYNGSDAGKDGAPPAVCHSFVTDGRIAFCGDSTHALAGQAVELPDLSSE
jgi:Family of unknown function (DUF6527)